ncbi:hypothetical protein C8R43DRAFT_1046306 [Mycena crocata]|nr:hypothetical protein C8R43DRAFT_1046306 [Mycena crocata]
MPSAVCPQPSAATAATATAAIYSMTTPAFGAMTPQRLQSPIHLDPRPRSTARSHCSSSQRRRTVRPRRRRHCARADCPVDSALHPFDRLPWTLALDTPPDALDLADIADLSQLVVDDSADEGGAVLGPIRRRKTSLRSNPLAPKPPPLHEMTPPHTPISHINHSRIHFHNLMPVFSCDHPAARS